MASRRSVDLAREKKLKYLRSTGAAGYMPPGPVRERIRHLHDGLGVTYPVIAERTGVDLETIKKHGRGWYNAKDGSRALVQFCHVSVYRRVMSARFTPEDCIRVDSTGVRRRLQALQTAGFSLPVLSGLTGVDLKQIHHVMSGRASFTYVRPETAQTYITLYNKLEGANPSDWGVPAVAQAQCRTRARKNGYAPASCWDPDTIDDPEAFPEWTGECGTKAGLHIHYRDRILPACPRCLAARPTPAPTKGKGGLSGEKLQQARLRRGLSLVELGKLMGVSDSTIHYWESGRSSPREQSRIDDLCTILKCQQEDIEERGAGETPEEDGRPEAQGAQEVAAGP